MQGVVIKSTGSHYIVKTNDGFLRDCTIRGKFRIQDIKSTSPLAVGDNVEVKLEGDDWIIVDFIERRNYIIRRSVNLSKQTHIIAANIDQAILMITVQDPITTTNFIDRFLASAYAYSIEVILLFNKLDLYTQESIKKHAELNLVYEKIGYRCLSLSAIHDDLSVLKEFMKNKLNLISGHSGVGKSTLINALQPGLNLTTKELSVQYKQGKHTTTFSEIHELDFGARVIDTPGIKGFGLVEMKHQEIGDYFPEFLSFKMQCKFNNCLHVNEPDCAVKSALQSGEIAGSRYISYLDIIEDKQESHRINDYG